MAVETKFVKFTNKQLLHMDDAFQHYVATYGRTAKTYKVRELQTQLRLELRRRE
jgi:hypothetical protein